AADDKEIVQGHMLVIGFDDPNQMVTWSGIVACNVVIVARNDNQHARVLCSCGWDRPIPVHDLRCVRRKLEDAFERYSGVDWRPYSCCCTRVCKGRPKVVR